MKRGSVQRAILFLWAAWGAAAQQPDAAQMQRYFEEGERALAANRYVEAAKAYENLSRLDPTSAELHARLGVIWFQAREYEKAIPELRRALKLKPALPNAALLLAMSLSELGQYKEALPALQSGFQSSRDSALKRLAGLHLQRSYTALGRHGKAVEVALELSQLYADDPEVLYETSRLFANYAYLELNKLSRTAPDSVWTHLASGETHESQGNYELAAAEYRRVRELSPDKPGIHYRLGRVLLLGAQQGDTQAEASKEFAAELDLDPTNANAAYELGELYRKAGDYDKARRWFEHALRHDPDFLEACLGLGKTLIALDRNADALPVLRKASALDPADEVPHFLLARAQKALGNEPAHQRELAVFQRLRQAKGSSQNPLKAPREVTRQGTDEPPR